MGYGLTVRLPVHSGRLARYREVMAPPFEIESIENTGRTDNSGLDTLWVVWLSAPGHERERFLFWKLERDGVPTEQEMRNEIVDRAKGFDNNENALDQFRAVEKQHPPDDPTRFAIQVGSCET